MTLEEENEARLLFNTPQGRAVLDSLFRYVGGLILGPNQTNREYQIGQRDLIFYLLALAEMSPAVLVERQLAQINQEHPYD